MIVEGSKVIYAGDTDPFQDVGVSGKVIALSGQAAHVQWLTGPKAGQIELVGQHELLPDRNQHQAEAQPLNSFDNTLDMPATETISVRATYEDLGEDGLVNALSEVGHLAMLTEYADEAVGHLVSRVRQDPALGEVLAQLEPDEADGLARRVAAVLLGDLLQEG